MKLTFALTLLISFPVFAADSYRTFTSADGRPLKAKIISYDVKRDALQIEREDRKKLTVSPTVFSEKDQTYIKKWHVAQVFMSESQFALSLKREEESSSKKEHEVDMTEENSGGRRGGGGGITTVAVDKLTKYKYGLTLDNKSNVQLNNITIEYRIYYNQQKAILDEKANKGRTEDSTRPERYMAVDQLKIKDASARLKPAKAESTRTVSTATITLTERTANRPWGDKINLKADLHGAWVRLTMKGPDGETLTRDVASSNSVMKKFPWEIPEEPAEDPADQDETQDHDNDQKS